MSDEAKREAFREMLMRLENEGICKQEYHDLGEVLGLIESKGIAYALPQV